MSDSVVLRSVSFDTSFLLKNNPMVDEGECIDCGTCVEECPVESIEL